MNRKFWMTVQSRYIPPGAVKVTDKKSDAVAYIYGGEINGRFSMRVFYGKQSRPVAAFYYRTEAERAQAVQGYFEGRRARQGRKTEEIAKRKAFVHPYKVGDLFRRSWGYDQTNVNYYEVVTVCGKMITVREIGCKSIETMNMQGRCTPQPGLYIGPERKCLAQDGHIKINEYDWAYFMKPEMIAGVPVYGTDSWSSYA